MASRSSLIEKISDYLQNRDKQCNFGECRRCDKKVYWSTSKVASHVRSGHCEGASEEEVQQFKQEFVYDTPKNLVHKSAVTKKFKESFEIEEYSLVKTPKVFQKRVVRHPEEKRVKVEEDDNEEHFILEESDETMYEEFTTESEEHNDSEKLEIVIIPESDSDSRSAQKPQSSSSTQDMSKEDKFINVCYPQFKGKTKLQLIEDILDLKRRNELLQVKTKTYENTINRLLN